MPLPALFLCAALGAQVIPNAGEEGPPVHQVASASPLPPPSGVLAKPRPPLSGPGLFMGAVSAQGDLRNTLGTRLGAEIGAWFAYPLGERLSLRPTVAFERFPRVANQFVYRSNRYNDFGVEDTRWSALSVGTDLVYAPAGTQLRLLTGFHLKSWRLQAYGSFTDIDKITGSRTTYTVDDTSTKNEPALAAGLAYPIASHLSAEARATFSSYRRQAYNTLQIRLHWAF